MRITASKDAARMLNPIHVGCFLRSEVVEAHVLSVTEAAGVLNVSRLALSSLLNGRASLSGEMALRFEKAFGVDMETLMRMQNSFDIAQARMKAASIRVARFRPK